MNSVNKGVGKVEVTLKWDPSPAGVPDHDLDIIAAVYQADDPHGAPAYLVHFGSRSPDGTITLNRDSRTGQGFGFDEAMTLELNRLSPAYARVVVGVAIQQSGGRRTFSDITNALVLVKEGYQELDSYDFTDLGNATAVTVVEFLRDGTGGWGWRRAVRGFDADPQSFTELMGTEPA
ncbi:TerD-family protein [Streptomyces sp. WAC05374]|uniref:TerD family protein n=1 Tax=unclassified Streptomyces TaxID=2593676 RepID=UPI000F89A197|nr:TerD family protein [Streptomyces sp. WAC05374]RST10208.1 TerD-family protein [Streptomyces sp. WAC05374]TDF43803.1 TerD-family protein [Streptomyces sp. WAC05374]TDF52030.1 TerD-family protein [Streptomyces sp. WAC05374]TDF54385.1 TerD-family protein [Streptomyces sp. WAC05374]